MGRKILGVITPTNQTISETYTYVRAWATGRIVKCQNIPNQPGNFLFFGYPATQSLSILNKYWEIIPEEQATYIGYPPTQTEKNKHNNHAFFNYKKRKQFESPEALMHR